MGPFLYSIWEKILTSHTTKKDKNVCNKLWGWLSGELIKLKLDSYNSIPNCSHKGKYHFM